jgi:hypothetical protein
MDGLNKELTASGFIVYPHGSRFSMMKVATPVDDRVMEPLNFDTYEEAANKANELYVFREYSFMAIARYNRGLGIEYKNIPEFSAATKEEAEKIAWEKAEALLGPEADVREIRVRLV